MFISTDFGISQKFIAEEGSETETSTAMTRKWASPEIIAHEPYGRSSDIFSLGCVFSEMHTVLAKESLDTYRATRASSDGSEAFHSTLPKIYSWLGCLGSKGLMQRMGYNSWDAGADILSECIGNMLARDPKQRPTAEQLVECLTNMACIKGWNRRRSKLCCEEGPEPFKLTDHQEIIRRLETHQKEHLSKFEEA
jgi:serine/threonine protein kinase